MKRKFAHAKASIRNDDRANAGAITGFSQESQACRNNPAASAISVSSNKRLANEKRIPIPQFYPPSSKPRQGSTACDPQWLVRRGVIKDVVFFQALHRSV